jgi:glycosyltransferase involved in cell wall biosynthesis
MASKFPYKVLIAAPSLDIMGGQAVQADLLIKGLRADGVEVGFVPHNPRPPGILYQLTKIKYVRTLIVSFFYICRLLCMIPNYDIVHVFSASYRSFLISPTPAILIAKYLGKKVIINYRSGECRDHLQRQGWIAIPILKMVDIIVVPSGYLVDEFADFGLKASYVYNLVDFTQFVYKPREEFSPRIIVARNLEKLYNINASVKAFKIVKEKYPEAKLTIVGAGNDEQNIRDFVKSENIPDISFTGRVERDDIAKLYAEHDIFLNSSDIDNMPVSFLEAYASGLAVVSTDAGGIPYICESGRTGLLVEKNDHEALAREMLRIIEDNGLGKSLTQSAKKECVKFTWPSVREGWHEVYRELYDG